MTSSGLGDIGAELGAIADDEAVESDLEWLDEWGFGNDAEAVAAAQAAGHF